MDKAGIQAVIILVIICYALLALGPQLITLFRRRKMTNYLVSVGIDKSVAGMIVWHHESTLGDGNAGVQKYMKNISIEKINKLDDEHSDLSIWWLVMHIKRAWKSERTNDYSLHEERNQIQ